MNCGNNDMYDDDAEISFSVGRRFLTGNGVEKDVEKARELLGQAAAMGHRMAAQLLASIDAPKEEKREEEKSEESDLKVSNADSCHMIINKMMRAAIRYNKGDAKRIHHLVKVHSFANIIGMAEHVNDNIFFVLEIAAILHDIGIHESEKRYGDCNGKHQEELGPEVAREIMAEIGGVSKEQEERICWLIAHHHTYDNVVDIDHRILLEADFLVNCYEDQIGEKEREIFEKKVFRSESAKEILRNM